MPTEIGAAYDPAATREREAATLVLDELDVSERAYLATCQKIYRRHSGCTSPFENFFRSLAHDVLHGTWPTPRDVEIELETFKDDFETMDQWARLFVEAYPIPATPESPAIGEPTQPATKKRAKAQRARKPRKKVKRAA